MAIKALGDHWIPDRAYYDQCERLAAETEIAVRSAALTRLGNHYAGTSDPRLLALMRDQRRKT